MLELRDYCCIGDTHFHEATVWFKRRQQCHLTFGFYRSHFQTLTLPPPVPRVESVENMNQPMSSPVHGYRKLKSTTESASVAYERPMQQASYISRAILLACEKPSILPVKSDSEFSPGAHTLSVSLLHSTINVPVPDTACNTYDNPYSTLFP